MKQDKTLTNFFNPRSVAVVGASETEGKVGHSIATNLLNLGYEGEIFMVNPKHETILNRPCYPSISKIDKQLDLAVIVIPAAHVLNVIEEAADCVKNFIVISAGFSEIGEEGLKREKQLLQLAKKKNLTILGPNCLGLINPNLNLNASFASGMPKKGNIAFASQSGALMVAGMDIAKKRNLAFSSLLSIGNKMQIGEIELMEEMANDPHTKVIGIYLEGIQDGPRFIETASKITKPIVILKAGKTEKSQKAISSHTGALSGSDEIASEALAKAGVIRANDLEEFFAILDLISKIDIPSNEKIAVITNAGGAGVLITDAFKNSQMKLAEISEAAKEILMQSLPEEGSVENPIDVLGDAQEDRYQKSLSVMENEDVGTIICILTPQEQTPVEKIADEIIKFKHKSEKNVLAGFIGGELVSNASQKLSQAGIPVFSFPESIISYLDKYYAWSISKHEQFENINHVNEKRRSLILKMIEHAKEEGRTALNFIEATQVMNLYGIPTVESAFLEEGEESSKLQYPVVLKVDSDKVLHKSDQKALYLNIKNDQEFLEAARDLQKRFPGEKILIQRMLDKGMELIVGIKRDEVFHDVVMFGLGGIYAEVFKMVDFIISPTTKKEILQKIYESKIGFLFQGARGQDPYNGEEFAVILEGIMSLAREMPEINEFDINPVIIYNNEKHSVAADVKIVF